MDDLISRQAVKDLIMETDLWWFEGKTMEILRGIKKLPTPTIAPVKHGKWQSTDDGWDGIYYVCSECGCPWTLIDGTPYNNGMNYCPNCGARMKGGEK